MKKTSGKRKKTKWARYAVLALVLLGAYHLFTGPTGIFNLAKLRHANRQRLNEMGALQARKEGLETEKKRLRGDSDYLELMARKELNMARPDEKVFRFMKTDSAEAQNKGKEKDGDGK